MPVTVVPRSSATVAIETFMTELSSAIRNCPAHRVSSTVPAVFLSCSPPLSVMSRLLVGVGSGRAKSC